MKQWEILEDVWIHGSVVSELILDKWDAENSGTLNFTSDPPDGIISVIKVTYIILGQISSCLKIIENFFFSSPPVEGLCASQSTFYTLKLVIVAALTLIVLMWRIGWAHNNVRK